MTECYSLVAWIQIGKQVIMGTNSRKTSPRFKRIYEEGPAAYELHAEMDVLNKASKIRSLEGSELHVMRFRKNGSIGSSKPCSHCMEFIRQHGIRAIHYINENGEWLKEKV